MEWLTERCAFHADGMAAAQSDMTNLFRASDWVPESKDSIVSEESPPVLA